MRIGKMLLALAVASALLLAMVACGGDNGNGGPGYNTDGTGTGGTGDGIQGGGTGTDDNTVVAEGFEFSPSTLEVNVGETVVWVNQDSATHDVEIEGENLGTFGEGEQLTWTADQPGSYSYLCTIHPQMTGTIVVQ